MGVYVRTPSNSYAAGSRPDYASAGAADARPADAYGHFDAGAGDVSPADYTHSKFNDT